MHVVPTCTQHPNGKIRRYRTVGPLGPGVYPQCLPGGGGAPHLLSWDQPASESRSIEVGIAEDIEAMSQLTRSELEVLCAAANGLTSLETSRVLHKGVETVKTQRHQILLKTGARNITQAVCIGTESGYLTVDRARALWAA
jgi:DNA-binding CsgD family transcriptional regulator